MDQHGLNECPRCGAPASGTSGPTICGHCGKGWAPAPAEIPAAGFPSRLPAPQDEHPDERLGADDLTNLALADDRLYGHLVAERWPERGKR